MNRPAAAAKFAWLSRITLLGASMICAASLVLIASRGRTQMFQPDMLQILLPFAVGALALAYVAFRHSVRGRALVIRELVLVVVTLLVVETFIAIVSPPTPSPQLTRARAAHRLGVPFDLRTKSEVVTQLRAEGADALPGISLGWPRQAFVRQQLPEGLYPLSQASDTTIVECNENGTYQTWKSDELGFNNPAGLVSSGHVSIAAVGASFTLGHCVSREHSLMGLIRARYGAVANFAMAGGGALTMLGAFREYVTPLHPPLVLWVMHPRTAATEGEVADPVLRRYLEPDFKQDLWARQGEVDRVWRDISTAVQFEFDRRSLASIRDAEAHRFKSVPLLTELRDRLHLGGPKASGGGERIDLEPFLQSVRMARETTRAWGGDFVVVIMPLYEEVIAHQLPPALYHDRLAKLLRDNQFEVIDAAEFFGRQQDPARLYTMRVNNHPNEAGYVVLANYVMAELGQRLKRLQEREPGS